MCTFEWRIYMGFGFNVKQARMEKRLSLKELSDKTGVSRSMLSQIEREEKNPTIQIACQIAEGLNVTLSQLLDQQDEKEIIIIRKVDRQILRDEYSGFERHLLSPSFPSKGIEFILNILPTQAETGIFPSHKHGVYEFITVVQGKLQAVLGVETYELDEGDSIYFDANLGHRFVNIGTMDCIYYLVIDSYKSRA